MGWWPFEEKESKLTGFQDRVDKFIAKYCLVSHAWESKERHTEWKNAWTERALTNGSKGNYFLWLRPSEGPIWFFIIFGILGAILLSFAVITNERQGDAIMHKAVYAGNASLTDEHVRCTDSGKGAQKCLITFHIDKEMAPPILVMYEVTRYFQTHSLSFHGVCADQVEKGLLVERESQLEEECIHFWKAPDGRIYHPCGLLGTHPFSDVFRVTNSSIKMNETDLVWPSDKNRFKAIPQSVKDANRHKFVFLDELTDGAISSVEDERFAVWLRHSISHSPHKLYGRIHQTLPAGSMLQFEVESTYWIPDSSEKSLSVHRRENLRGTDVAFSVLVEFVGGLILVFVLFALLSNWRSGWIDPLRWFTGWISKSKKEEAKQALVKTILKDIRLEIESNAYTDRINDERIAAHQREAARHERVRQKKVARLRLISAQYQENIQRRRRVRPVVNWEEYQNQKKNQTLPPPTAAFPEPANPTEPSSVTQSESDDGQEPPAEFPVTRAAPPRRAISVGVYTTSFRGKASSKRKQDKSIL